MVRAQPAFALALERAGLRNSRRRAGRQSIRPPEIQAAYYWSETLVRVAGILRNPMLIQMTSLLLMNEVLFSADPNRWTNFPPDTHLNRMSPILDATTHVVEEKKRPAEAAALRIQRILGEV